jgi:phenylacetate-CoA ligase
VGFLQDTLYPGLPVFVQNLACSAAGYARHRARFTRHFHETLAEWEKSVDGPVDRLHEIQRRRLDHLVRRAREHVPYFHELPMPSDAKDPAEAMVRTLAEIPTLEKSVYRDRAEEFVARDIPRRALISGKTSGTTGSALPLWYTSDTLAEEFASFWRGRRRAGARIRDANLTFNGQIVVPFRETRPPFWRTNHWGHQTLFSLYHMSPENLPLYVDAIHARPARFIQGYPSSMHLIAQALLAAGRPIEPGCLMAAFTSSESLLAFQRDSIEAAFGCPVVDRYGVSEFCVSMTECSERRLHVDMEFCIVEVEIHEETDDYVRGPLLVTGLSNDATPFLRYRVGDVGTRSKRPCPCGRPGEVFLEIDGRIEDYVMTPDGRLVGRLDHIFKEQLDVAEAQVLQERKNALEVLIVPRDSYDDRSERGLLREFRSRLGDEIEISIRHVTEIPRESNGKFRAVKSTVGSLSR